MKTNDIPTEWGTMVACVQDELLYICDQMELIFYACVVGFGVIFGALIVLIAKVAR